MFSIACLKRGNRGHRLGGQNVYNIDGTIKEEIWLRHGKRHCFTGPAVTSYYNSGLKREEEWFINGKLHRVSGPAVIRYYPDGKTKKEEGWVVNGKYNMLYGPTMTLF